MSAYQLRRAARRDCEADDAAPPVDDRRMAQVRLAGVLDAMQRAGLTASRLVALADRLAAGYEVASDSALLDALPRADLRRVKLTAPAFMIASAQPFRCVVATFRGMGIGDADLLIPPVVAGEGRRAGKALGRRFRALPDAEWLGRLGDALERGSATPSDLAIVRALPAVYLRGKASGHHWRVFAQYRDA